MTGRLDEELTDPEVRRTYEEEYLFGEATDTIVGLLSSLRLSQRELAGRLEVSDGRVSQILSGGENLTLRTLASIGWALGVRFDLNPVPMADRRGTPAVNDSPLPAWLQRLREEPGYRFERDLRLPAAHPPSLTRPRLSDFGEEVRAA